MHWYVAVDYIGLVATHKQSEQKHHWGPTSEPNRGFTHLPNCNLGQELCGKPTCSVDCQPVLCDVAYLNAGWQETEAELASEVTDDLASGQGAPTQGAWRTTADPDQTGWTHRCT